MKFPIKWLLYNVILFFMQCLIYNSLTRKPIKTIMSGIFNGTDIVNSVLVFFNWYITIILYFVYKLYERNKLNTCKFVEMSKSFKTLSILFGISILFNTILRNHVIYHMFVIYYVFVYYWNDINERQRNFIILTDDNPKIIFKSDIYNNKQNRIKKLNSFINNNTKIINGEVYIIINECELVDDYKYLLNSKNFVLVVIGDINNIQLKDYHSFHFKTYDNFVSSLL